jgi:protein involved in sex pheromone biosynthesis
MKIIYISFSILLLAMGCAHQFDLMKAHAVSMKHYHLPQDKKLVKVTDIKSEFCMKSFQFSSGKDIGLIDEVIKEAEKKYNVDFILNASFHAKGSCIILEGEGFRLN